MKNNENVECPTFSKEWEENPQGLWTVNGAINLKCDGCHFDSNFLRHCDTINGGFITKLFDLTAEECRKRCSDDYSECAKAHHHPGGQVWQNDGRTNCWLWTSQAMPCTGAGATGERNPGATMIRCDESKLTRRLRGYGNSARRRGLNNEPKPPDKF